MNWRFNITTKMLGYLLAASIGPLLLGLTAFQISKRVVIEHAKDENACLLGSFSSYLSLYNDQVEDMAANIAGNAAIGLAIRNADARATSAFGNLEMRTQMGRILNSYVRVKGLVAIDIFSNGGEHLHVGETLNVSEISQTKVRKFLDEALTSRSPNLWRGIDDNLNDEIMRTFLKGVPLAKGMQLMRLDRNGNIALHSDSQRFDQPLTPALLNLVRAESAVQQFTLDEEEVLMNLTLADSQQRRLVVVTPRQLQTKKVNLKRNPHRIEMQIAPEIQMDSLPGPLGQVVINLINNADLHAFEGLTNGVLTIKAAPQGDQVLLRFSDNGVGIPPNHMDRLFESFFSTKIGKRGTGLGMAIVQNLVTKTLGCYITVRSTLAQGFNFWTRSAWPAQ